MLVKEAPDVFDMLNEIDNYFEMFLFIHGCPCGPFLLEKSLILIMGP